MLVRGFVSDTMSNDMSWGLLQKGAQQHIVLEKCMCPPNWETNVTSLPKVEGESYWTQQSEMRLEKR